MGAMSVPIGVRQSASGWSLALSLLIILAGIAAIAMPWAAAVAVNILVGWLLVFSGAFHLVLAWQLRHHGVAIWEGLVGLLYAATGVFVLARPTIGLISLALALAAYLLAEGILELILYFRLHGVSGSGWFLFDGIVTVILAVMIWRLWPSGSAYVIGTLVGISMLFSGTARLMLTMTARRLTSKTA